jgi:hypothetical protein
MVDGLLELERQVLQKLLSGEHPIIGELRAQLAGLQVADRELTGAGFMTSFTVNQSLKPISLQGANFKFGDVVADIQGLEHGAGFLLYVKDGCIDALEGYTFDEPWPDTTGQFRLSYVNEDRRELSKLDQYTASNR